MGQRASEFDEALVRDNVPACLRERAQWVCWTYIFRNGKRTKCPINPATGRNASSTDSATWGTFEQALAARRASAELAGVGFVFTAEDPFAGVDLDHCIDVTTHHIKPWSQAILHQLDSYCEVSPSGAGVKVFVRAVKSGTRCKTGYEDGAIEMYDRDRFFTVTGQRLADKPAEVEDRQDSFDGMYSRVFAKPAVPPSPQTNPSNNDRAELDDDQIIRIACASRKSGAKFAALWAGRWNGQFNSQSEADSSLVFTLAFYTKDAVQIDRIFRRSGLMRDKWNEPHGAQTYGQMTIAKALATVTGQYEPRKRRSKAQTSVDGGSGEPISGEPAPGTIEPATGRLILSTDRTLPTAESYVRQFHQHADGTTLRHYLGTLLHWRDNRYVEVEDDVIRNRLLPWMHAAVRMVYDPRRETWVTKDFPANPRTVNTALESLRSFTHLSGLTRLPSWLDQNVERPRPSELIACRSALLHLPSMQKFPPSPAFFNTASLDVDHDPSAPQPVRWWGFLDQLFGDDREARDLLQDWFGYCIGFDTSQQKMLLIVGPRRSGKGTIARVLTQLAGRGNVVGPTTSSLAGAFGLQPLIGKSLAIVSDARFGGDGISTVVERLLTISGEDIVTIDRKYLGAVSLKLPTRFMFLTNELPRLTDSSGALAGRFLIIRLTESFYGREDPSLTEKLLDELPGILNWSIVGWHRLRDRGRFVQPRSVQGVLRELEDLASPVGAFVRERCDVGTARRGSVDDIYTAWTQWCDAAGCVTTTNKQAFGRDLAAAVPGILTRTGTGGRRFFQGLGLKKTRE